MDISPLVLFQRLTEDLEDSLGLDFHRVVHPDSGSTHDVGPSLRERAAQSLSLNFLKKFEGEKKPDADSKALEKFLSSNQSCRLENGIDYSMCSEIERTAIGEFKSTFFRFWFNGWDPILTYSSVANRIGTGPGASILATGTSFYHKIAAGPLSSTSQYLVDLYNGIASRNPLWWECEMSRSSHFGAPVLVDASKLYFVPKNSEISRTICVEPSLNMLFQKGIGAVIEERLVTRFGINLATQPDINRLLSQTGSKSGSYGTIDMSSASDTISIGLMREICPPDVFGWLMSCRTSNTLLPDGSTVQLQMVSSMGNAFTFPLQTLIFSCIIAASYKALGIRLIRPSESRLPNFACFGDDLVVSAKAYGLIVSLLGRFGFQVNPDKSFNEGAFRESCGMDFYAGVNIRPVFLRSLRTRQDRYSLINRLNVWSARWEIPLARAISYLAGSVKFLPIPAWDNDDAGIKVPLHLASPERLKRKYGSYLYKRFVPHSSKASLLNVEQRPPRGYFSGLFLNPSGILLAAVGGYLRNGDLSRRVTNPFYKERIATAPCWDWLDARHPLNRDGGWHNWVTFYVALNLGRD